MIQKHIIMVISVLIVVTSLFGSELTLSDALAAAKENNGTIKVATLQLQQSLRNTETNNYLPSLELEAGVSASGSIINGTFSSTYTVGGISWSLNTATASQSKALSRQTADNTYQSTLNTVSSNVTTAYWNVVAADLSLQSAKNVQVSAQSALDKTKAKFEAGKSTTLAVSQAELTESDAEYAVLVAGQTRQSALSTLSNLTGLSGDWTFQDMPQAVIPKSVDALLAKASDTTTIKRYQLLIDSADLSKKTTTNKYVSPSVNVSASTKVGGTLYSTTSKTSIADSTTVAVTVSLPLDHLISSSSAAVALDSADYDTKIARQNYANALASLQSSIKTAHVKLGQASSNLEKLGKHLELAQEQLTLIQDSYEAGKSSYSDYQNAMLSVENAKLSILQQKLNYTIALYDLSALVETDINAVQAS